MTEIEQSLTELHHALGMKELNPLWAKAEIFLGLTAAAIGLMIAVRALASASLDSDWLRILISMALMVFGAYLAMAGHRSHLYQSSNRLAAYLAGEIGKLRQ
jgi:hypothetical protein